MAYQYTYENDKSFHNAYEVLMGKKLMTPVAVPAGISALQVWRRRHLHHHRWKGEVNSFLQAGC